MVNWCFKISITKHPVTQHERYRKGSKRRAFRSFCGTWPANNHDVQACFGSIENEHGQLFPTGARHQFSCKNMQQLQAHPALCQRIFLLSTGLCPICLGVVRQRWRLDSLEHGPNQLEVWQGQYQHPHHWHFMAWNRHSAGLDVAQQAGAV